MPEVECKDCGHEAWSNYDREDYVCSDCSDKPSHGKKYVEQQCQSKDEMYYRACVINNDR